MNTDSIPRTDFSAALVEALAAQRPPRERLLRGERPTYLGWNCRVHGEIFNRESALLNTGSIPEKLGRHLSIVRISVE